MMAHTLTEIVADVMTERPLTVHPDSTMADAFAVMELHGIASCPVVNEAGALQGMVSRIDLLRALRPSRELRVLDGGEVGNLPVRENMHCGVVTVEPTDPLVAAVDLFIETRFHAIPVVRRDSGPPIVVGVLTQGDALRHLMSAGRPAVG